MKFRKWRKYSGYYGLFGSNCINHSSITLEECGLEPELEFLSGFIEDYCEELGSDNIAFQLENDEQVFDLFDSIIAINDFEYCVMFAITEENMLLSYIRYEDDIVKMKSKKPIEDLSEIGEMFYELDLDCFSLIVESSNGEYKIIGE